MKNTDKKEGFIDKLQRVLMPIGTKLAQQRHLSAISGGVMIVVPLTILGAFINILANPPVTAEMIEGGGFATIFSGWFNFAQQYHDIIMIPYNMTMGIFSLAACIGIAYNLAKSYKLKALSTSIIATVMFLMVAAPSTPAYLASMITPGIDMTQVAASGMLPTSYLDAQGLFTAIIVAFVSVEITRFCQVKNLVIKMPDSVPPVVSESFSSIIPAVLNLVVIFGVNLILIETMELSLPAAITKLLTPAVNGINSPLMVFILAIFAMMLWCFGIHGSAIVMPLTMPIAVQAVSNNAALVAAGQAPEFSPIFLITFMAVGGAGCTLGFAILASRSKSAQLKMIGRIGVIPGLCNINEPLIYGTPIIYNPVMMIPFILSPIVCMLLAWFGFATGFLYPPINFVMASLPMGVAEFLLTTSFNNVIFAFLLIPIQMLVFYPFFKVYERHLIKQEEENEKGIKEANAI